MENIFACAQVMDLTEESAKRCANVKNTYLKYRQSRSKPVGRAVALIWKMTKRQEVQPKLKEL